MPKRRISKPWRAIELKLPAELLEAVERVAYDSLETRAETLRRFIREGIRRTDSDGVDDEDS